MSHQNLAGSRKELVYLLLSSCIDHVHGPHTVRAEQTRGRAEKSADEGALRINLATMLAQMRAAQLGQRGSMFSFGLDWQSGHFFRRGSDGTAAIVATDNAGERWNAFAQFVDFPIIARHCSPPFPTGAFSIPWLVAATRLRTADKIPCSNAAGDGGHPGTVTSTGMTLQMPPRLA